MNLLLCFLSYTSPDLRLAGGTTHFVENLRRWPNSRTESQLLTTSDGAHLLSKLGVKCNLEAVAPGTTFLMKSGVGSAISLLLRVLIILFRFEQRGFQLRADAVCTESHFLPDVLAAILVRRRNPRIPLISYLHHIIPVPNERRYHPLFPSLLSWTAQALSLALMKHYGFHVLTFPAIRSQLLSLGFSNERIRCINNGVDLEYISKIPNGERRYDACFLGNALARKGVLDLPKVWRTVCDVLPHSKLAIVGTGREQDIEKLNKNFSEKKLGNNVCFLGYLPEDQKFAVLKASGVFLFPSYEEGWGIVVAEAMACGLPVVAYDLPAYRATFKRGMVTVPVGSTSDLARTTIALLSDRERMRELGEQGRVQASEYDINRVAATELSLIRKILNPDPWQGRQSRPS
jgi:glycosyltransferase involved in cell wall biosynthesis